MIVPIHSKGRETAILEMDLKIDDLLEKKNQGVEQLDMEYGKLSHTLIRVRSRRTDAFHRTPPFSELERLPSTRAPQQVSFPSLEGEESC